MKTRKIYINCSTIKTKNDVNGNPRAIACINVRLFDKNKLEKNTTVLSAKYSYMSELQACEHVLNAVLKTCSSINKKTFKITKGYQLHSLSKKDLKEDLLFILIDHGTSFLEFKNFKSHATNLEYEASKIKLTDNVEQFLKDAGLIPVENKKRGNI